MQPFPKNEWRRRRNRLDIGLLFLGGLIVYVLWYDSDSEVQQAAITVLIPSFVSLIGAYIFGAAWDDKNYMDNISRIGSKDSESDASYPIDANYPR
jgi:hypothetical protein